jgi:transcriptional regulator
MYTNTFLEIIIFNNFKGKTQMKVAEKIDISQAQISIIEKKCTSTYENVLQIKMKTEKGTVKKVH